MNFAVDMGKTTDAAIYQVEVNSAILSTIMVVVVDVLVVCLVLHSLHAVGAFLTARRVLSQQKSMSISEMRFEEFTGRTRGPLWFRYTQALLKIMVFSASIVMSLSLNGGTRPRIEKMSNQTILVQTPRNLQTLGLGDQRNSSSNFSQELLFTLQQTLCGDNNPEETVFYNFRSTALLNNTYSNRSTVPFEIRCLNERNNYCHPPLRSENTLPGRWKCNPEFPIFPDEVQGNFTAPEQNCSFTAFAFDCFAGSRVISCAAFFTDERGEWLLSNVYFRTGGRNPTAASVPSGLRRGNETLAVILRYLAHDPTLSATQCLQMALYQAAPNSIVNAISQKTKAVTEIKKILFLPSLAIISAVLVICCCLGLIAKAMMIYTKRDTLDLGSSPEEVARLATMKPGERKERKAWYLKIHPDSPHVTISTDSTNKGIWPEEEVVNKYRKRD